MASKLKFIDFATIVSVISIVFYIAYYAFKLDSTMDQLERLEIKVDEVQKSVNEVKITSATLEERVKTMNSKNSR